MISNRVKLVLEDLIAEDQTAFTKGRDISQNIRKTLDIQDIAFQRNLVAVLISVDFEKAFDKVEHNSLIQAFSYFGFPEYMLQWLTILFKDMWLCTINDGFTSNWFMLTHGIYQGNPIGPYGFVCLIEILAIKLRNHREIKGLKIESLTYLLSMFADDLNMFMEFNQNSWQATMNTFADFSENTGLVINYKKTTVYRLGSLRNSDAQFYSSRKIQWTNEPIYVLGMHIAHQDLDICKLNLDELLAKATSILDTWHHRKLSFFGKILIVNSLVQSLFMYRMKLLPKLPRKFLKDIKQKILQFIWDKGTPKIRYDILIALKDEGGA